MKGDENVWRTLYLLFYENVRRVGRDEYVSLSSWLYFFTFKFAVQTQVPRTKLVFLWIDTKLSMIKYGIELYEDCKFEEKQNFH